MRVLRRLPQDGTFAQRRPLGRVGILVGIYRGWEGRKSGERSGTRTRPGRSSTHLKSDLRTRNAYSTSLLFFLNKLSSFLRLRQPAFGQVAKVVLPLRLRLKD